jgi:hypothetical protein
MPRLTEARFKSCGSAAQLSSRLPDDGPLMLCASGLDTMKWTKWLTLSGQEGFAATAPA